MTLTSTDWMANAKDRAPRGIKDAANATTRAYGVATARWRPYPDFLIVGTKRGGTTSLWNYLADHRQVLPMFPAPRGSKSNAYWFAELHRGDAWYRSHFHTHAYRRLRERAVGGRVVTGEASPYYMYGPHLPARIAAHAPSTRLLVLLRDPVERAYGHYQERVKQGVETLGFEEALAAEEARVGPELDRVFADPDYYSPVHDFFAYRDRGIYLPQLERIYAAFPREQVLVLRAEDLYTDAQRLFDEVCVFLGIEPEPIARPEHHNYIPRDPIAPGTAAELRAFYAPHNRALEALEGRSFGWNVA